MNARRLALEPGDIDRLARELAPPPPDPAIATRVGDILSDVREQGDAALVELTRQFDCPDFRSDQIRVSGESIAEAASELDPELRKAIEVAADQVRALADRARPSDLLGELPFGQQITLRQLPVASAGLYVPGGRAPYPSSLIMAAVPAQVAGVERICVVTPPADDGVPHRVILGAAGVLGLTEIYAVGGPASIGALAFGTSTIAPVAMICGPGSAWVQEAKRQVVGVVGIDAIAGPSELVVIADGSAEPREVAWDLLGQAEHGPDSPAILVSPDKEFVDRVQQAITEGSADGAITLLDAPDLETAAAFAEAFAPEHLQLQTSDAAERAMAVRHAGAVFVGANGGTAFGDYVAGSNHILPTGGAARFGSSVSASTFMRRMAVIDLPDGAVRELTPHLSRLADAEGFVNHRRSAEVRAERIAGEGAHT